MTVGAHEPPPSSLGALPDTTLRRLARLAARAADAPAAVLLDARGPLAWHGAELASGEEARRWIAELARAATDTVAEAHGIAALAAPIRLPGGGCAGCVIALDRAPRAWDPRDLEGVQDVVEAARAELARGDRATAGPDFHRGLVERAADAILVQRDGRIVYTNPAWRRLVGCAEGDDVVGRHVAEFLPPPYLHTVAAHVLAGLGEVGLGPPVSSQLTRLDGTVLDVEVVATPFLLDGEPAAEVVVRDVTGRREAEAALARRDAKLRLLLGQVPALIWSADREGRITSVLGGTSSVVTRLGRPIVGTAVADFLGWAKDDAVAAHRRALEDAPSTFELAVDDCAIEVHTEPLRDGAGGIVGSVGVAVDVTLRRRLEAEVREAQRLDALGRLAGGVAHEVSNMMMVVLAHVERLAQEVGPERASTVDAIRRAGERAAAVANQVLAFGRRQVLQPVPVALGALVERVGGMMRRPLGEDVELTTWLEAPSCVVEVDPGQLEQVLVNLLLNARDALPRGGRIVVALERRVFRDAGPTARDPRAPGPYAVLSVTDNGTGMDAATLERAFEPFFTTKAAGRGTGLGLSTAYGIVRQSRGTIVAHSRPGLGTRMEVWLPLASAGVPAAPTPPARPPSVARPSARAIRVLLVEDEVDARTVLADGLAMVGFEVTAAADGQEALELVEGMAAPPDVVVTDLVMPRLGGRELAEHLAARVPGLPVLFFSGYGGDEIARRGLIASETQFLQKPVSLATLAEAIRRLAAARAEAPEQVGIAR